MVTVILCVFLLSYVYGEGKVSYNLNNIPYHALTVLVRATTSKAVSSYSLTLSSSSASILPATPLTSSLWASIASIDSRLEHKARNSKPSAGREVGEHFRFWVSSHCLRGSVYKSIFQRGVWGWVIMENIVRVYTEHCSASYICRCLTVYICFLNMLDCVTKFLLIYRTL